MTATNVNVKLRWRPGAAWGEMDYTPQESAKQHKVYLIKYKKKNTSKKM